MLDCLKSQKVNFNCRQGNMQLAIASFIAISRKQKLAAMSMSGKCEAFDNLFKFGACETVKLSRWTRGQRIG